MLRLPGRGPGNGEALIRTVVDYTEKVTEANVTRVGVWSRIAVLGLMFLVLALAGILSAVTAMKFAIQGGEVTVPDLSRAPESEAIARLAEQDLELVVDGRRFSDVVPEGLVLDQSPVAGTRVKRERRVRVRVSLGEREFPVPELTGNTLRSAQLILTERGLAVGGTLYAHAADTRSGTVLFQNPPAGASESDPAVSMLISLGPVDQYFVMPRLTGMRAIEARARIREAGFGVTEVPNEDAGVAAGTVTSQMPAPGHRVSKDDTIVLGVTQ